MKSAVFTVTIAALIAGLFPAVTGCGGSDGEEPLPPVTETPGNGQGLPTAPPDGEQPTTGPGEDWEPDGVLGDNEYLGEVQYRDYELRWATDGEYVYFGIRVKTDGWVALGLNPSSRMKDADMIVGAVDGGQVIISDEFSTGTIGPHRADTELGGTDDITKYGGSEQGGYTIIELSRRLDTGDSYDSPLAPGTVTIIWAYGTSDDTGKQHSSRGTGEITL